MSSGAEHPATSQTTLCQGCPGRGTGGTCCMCSRPIPVGLRRTADTPSELVAVTSQER